MGPFSDEEVGSLQRWLAPRLGASEVQVGGFGKPSSGYSAETTVFDATPDGAAPVKLVLRRETPDPAVYPMQRAGLDVEVAIQYRVMEALTGTGVVPLAPLVGYEDDPAVLGAPFFVMRFVEGQVPIESPPYPSAGFFVDATPDERRRLLTEGLRALARVHAVDHRAAGLDWLEPEGAAPGTSHQLALWKAYAVRELEGRVHEPLERAWAWLEANVPADRSIGLCWGDPRPGNIIWHDFRPACLTDFEASSIASPDQDLGWWLMFDRTMHESVGVPRLDGDLSRGEQRAIYAEAAGIAVPDTTYYEVFAAARYAAIVVRVMNRLVARGQLPADHRIWIENPVVPCLQGLLDEHC
jgi:aminoglycoside phosphotransferase (APT) family kinase protein